MAAIDTPMVAHAAEYVAATLAAGGGSGMARLKTQSPLMAADSGQRMATVWEQAGPILFLLSDDASNITGSIMATDGGWTTY